MFRDFLFDNMDKIIMAIMAIMVIVILLMISNDLKEEKAWLEYAEKNGCEVVETVKGRCQTSTHFTYITNGKGGNIAPVLGASCASDQKKYVCDNNEIFWR